MIFVKMCRHQLEFLAVLCRCLTRILSRDTPTVCLTVERVVLSGCWRLTDRGLRTIARHCTELRTLDLAHCQRVSNVALFDVISRCVSLSHLDVTGTSSVLRHVCPGVKSVLVHAFGILVVFTSSFGLQYRFYQILR